MNETLLHGYKLEMGVPSAAEQVVHPTLENRFKFFLRNYEVGARAPSAVAQRYRQAGKTEGRFQDIGNLGYLLISNASSRQVVIDNQALAALGELFEVVNEDVLGSRFTQPVN